jgi:LysM repeat protein
MYALPPATVTVHPGDTLSAIAGRACGDPADYLALAYNNDVANPDLIYAGQVFQVACQAAAQAIADRYNLLGSAPQPVHYASQPSQAPQQPVSQPVVTSVSGTIGSSSMQSCIIARESGGNAQAVNPSSGAGGLYQFLPSTWQALGHSGLPENASVAEQNQAYAQEVAQDGYSAWTAYDGCTP